MDAYKTTDRMLKETEKKLSEIYSRAEKELSEKTQKFWDDFARKDAKKKKLLDAGAITDEEYKRWRIGQVMTGKHWEEMTKTVSDEMLKADKTAMAYVNEKLPEVYSVHYNALGDENSALKGYSFEMVDAHTVKNLAMTDKTLLPYKTVNGKKVERWDTQKVNSEVMQGILQGENSYAIAKRLQNVAGMEKESAIRNARTAFTGAEGKGRIDSYHEAEKQGIVLVKVWRCLHDLRTRDWHAELDNAEVPVDEPFVNHIDGGKKRGTYESEIMYPGDPGADPANVYNCRCRLVSKVKGFVRPDTGELIEFESEEEQKTAERMAFYSQKLEAALGDKYAGAQSLIENSDAAGAFQKYSDTCNSVVMTKNGGCYRTGFDRVEASYSNYSGQSEYSTLMHEMNHMIDHHMLNTDLVTFSEINKINKACEESGWMVEVLKARPSSSDEFLAALRSDMDALKGAVSDKTIRGKLFEVGNNATAGVQDALDGFFGTQKKGLLGWGHGDSYYNRVYNHRFSGNGLDKALKSALNDLGFDASNQTKVKALARHYEAASEAWANVGSAVVCGGDELKAVEKFMPKTLEAYRKIIKGVK